MDEYRDSHTGHEADKEEKNCVSYFMYVRSESNVLDNPAWEVTHEEYMARVIQLRNWAGIKPVKSKSGPEEDAWGGGGCYWYSGRFFGRLHGFGWRFSNLGRRHRWKECTLRCLTFEVQERLCTICNPGYAKPLPSILFSRTVQWSLSNKPAKIRVVRNGFYWYWRKSFANLFEEQEWKDMER